MRFSALFMLSALLPAVAAHARAPACSPAGADLHAASDACIAAHVYDVVTVQEGTRFLDLCSPDTSDDACHISIVSYKKDTKHVGDLESFRGKDITIRGALQIFDGRYVLVLNDPRQFHGGVPRFTPDPRLAHGSPSEYSESDDAKELRVNFHHHGRKLAPE
jgi:hypothetical protein